jgi:hypothetical protein
MLIGLPRVCPGVWPWEHTTAKHSNDNYLESSFGNINQLGHTTKQTRSKFGVPERMYTRQASPVPPVGQPFMNSTRDGGSLPEALLMGFDLERIDTSIVTSSQPRP